MVQMVKTAQVAAEALTDLNIFEAVVVVLEGGIYTSGGKRSASRIIRICKAEQQRQLRSYDAALRRLL